MVDIKKCLAFIKANASEVPKTTRIDNEWIFPTQIVEIIKGQIDEHSGSFAIDKEEFNKQFGWNPSNSKSLYLKRKLNKQYPLDYNKRWHVGTIAKGTLYKFEVIDTIVEVEE